MSSDNGWVEGLERIKKKMSSEKSMVDLESNFSKWMDSERSFSKNRW